MAQDTSELRKELDELAPKQKTESARTLSDLRAEPGFYECVRKRPE